MTTLLLLKQYFLAALSLISLGLTSLLIFFAESLDSFFQNSSIAHNLNQLKPWLSFFFCLLV
jgi:hypothetical protein